VTAYKRGNSWVAKVWTNGRWRWLGTHSTRKDARAAEQAASPRRSSRLTVEDFCVQWLRDYARPAAATQRNQRYGLAAFRREYGGRRLDSIERPEAHRWARSVPYTAYRTVREMYADALRDGFVQINPFTQLRIPIPQGRRHIDVLTEDDVKALADKALDIYDEHFGPTVHALILVAGYVGLRPAELAQLDWGGVDLHRSLLHVRHASSGTGQRKGPKTEAGRRICVLPPPARDALAELERHEGMQAVFVTPRGHRFNKGSLQRYFATVRAAFGRPEITPYWLRHACATLLLERGLSPEDVAAHLGHKDGGVLIRRLYGHPDQDRQRERIAMAFAEVPSKPVAFRSQTGPDRA
jgi:integrase